ncbi:hypothetical protein OIDMADRAFT_19786, partial [Oidiodendron maius Zn]
MLQTCTSNGISGKTNNVRVHNTCTAVGLSNRGNHCWIGEELKLVETRLRGEVVRKF